MSGRADALKAALIGTGGRLLLDALMHSARFEVRNHPAYTALMEARQPVAYALWHGRLLPLTWHHRGEGIAALISLSKDGEYIARIVEGWGYEVVRGSSSRGGRRALAQMIRHGRERQSLAFTPDGPRGPREKMKSGVLLAAQRAGIPIVPLSAATTRAWWFEGWDRFLVPKPFSRIIVQHGEPVYVDRSLDDTGIETLARELEDTLNRIQSRLDAEVNGDGVAALDGDGADTFERDDVATPTRASRDPAAGPEDA